MDFLFRQIKKKERIIRYLIAGGAVTGINLALLYILTDWLDFWYLFSAIIAFIGAFFASFFLHKLWTFRDKSGEQAKQQLAIFLLIALTTLAGNAFLMYVLVDIFRVWYMLAQVIISVLIAFFSYNSFRIFVFKSVKMANE